MLATVGHNVRHDVAPVPGVAHGHLLARLPRREQRAEREATSAEPVPRGIARHHAQLGGTAGGDTPHAVAGGVAAPPLAATKREVIRSDLAIR